MPPKPPNRAISIIVLGVVVSTLLNVSNAVNGLPNFWYIQGAIVVGIVLKIIFAVTDRGFYFDSEVLENALPKNLVPTRMAEDKELTKRFYLYNEDKDLVINSLKVYTYKVSKKFTPSFTVADTSKGTGTITLNGNDFSKKAVRKQLEQFIQDDFELDVIDLHEHKEIVDTGFEKRVKKELFERANHRFHNFVDEIMFIPLALILLGLIVWQVVYHIQSGVPFAEAIFLALTLALFSVICINNAKYE